MRVSRFSSFLLILFNPDRYLCISTGNKCTWNHVHSLSGELIFDFILMIMEVTDDQIRNQNSESMIWIDLFEIGCRENRLSSTLNFVSYGEEKVRWKRPMLYLELMSVLMFIDEMSTGRKSTGKTKLAGNFLMSMCKSFSLPRSNWFLPASSS